MDEKIYECDLHSHTKRSDGADSYEQIIANAVRRGLKVLAITDHDIRPELHPEISGRAVDLQQYGREQGIILIPGIEFSCNTQVEDVHIVGLACDFSHTGFAGQEELTRKSKLSGYEALCIRLTEMGMPITLQEVAEAQGEGFVPGDIQKKQIFELMAKKGYASDWSQAKLLVKNSRQLQIKREKPQAEAVIQLIKESGGVAILAHPYLIEEPLVWGNKEASRAEYIERLIAAGLDGIEGAYTYNKTSYGGDMSPQEIEYEIREKYEGRIAFISGGSDYHDDAAKGVKKEKCRYLGEKGISFSDFEKSPLGYLAK